MPDNPTNVAAPWFALPGHAVVALTGVDAVKFAQAQFMNDVAALADGHWQWNGWLTPKGRVMALFALLRFDARTFWLLLPDHGDAGDAQALAEALRRYVFRAKVTLTVRESLHVGGGFEAAPASAAVIAGSEASTVELDMSGEGGVRRLRICAEAAPEDIAARNRWGADDLRHGLPRLPASQREQWTPQQLSLSRLNAYSVKKGCYPGQEIVARTHFLGQAKRGLVLLEGEGSLAPGATVELEGQRVGNVVSASAGVALAVAGEVAPGATLQADGIACRQLPLLGGLAR